MPRINELFDRLKGSLIFSSADLKAGFWQFKVNANSRHKLAFSTRNDHYECLKMPFGVTNAPIVCSRIMEIIFGDMPNVLIYMDDITIHTKAVEEHIKAMNEVFKRLKEAGLRLNPQKCFWMKVEIKMLGHIITANTISMDPKKIEPIVTRTAPRNIKELQSWLGGTGYYRRFTGQDITKITRVG